MRPLQKMTIGGIFAAISFVFTGFVQMQIEANPTNSIPITWQLPQYIALSVGEIMCSVIGLEFSYEQAPKTMKSVVFSLWLLTIAFGNLITLVLISSVHIFENQSHEFFFFAGLMFVDIMVFGILAYYHKPSVRTWIEKEDYKLLTMKPFLSLKTVAAIRYWKDSNKIEKENKNMLSLTFWSRLNYCFLLNMKKENCEIISIYGRNLNRKYFSLLFGISMILPWNFFLGKFLWVHWISRSETTYYLTRNEWKWLQ